MAYLKRLVTPKSWPLPRKGSKYVVKPMSGSHSYREALPLIVILREILGLVDDRREAKKILHENLVLVDNKVVKEEKFPVGLFDRITIKKVEKNYTIYFTHKGKLVVKEISDELALIKPCKIMGKVIINKDKGQVNCSDGRNFLLPMSELKTISVYDSILLDLKNKKISRILKLSSGARIFVIGGKHVGEVSEVKDVKENSVMLTSLSPNEEYEILKKNVFVIEDKEVKSINAK